MPNKARAKPAAKPAAKGAKARGDADGPPEAPRGAYYVEDGVDSKGKKKWKLRWRSTEKMPAMVSRNLSLISGERYARRPSALAKKENKRRSTDVLKADEFDGNRDSWASSDMMPEENHEADTGWKPGPIARPLPTFQGPKPGPTNPSSRSPPTPPRSTS